MHRGGPIGLRVDRVEMADSSEPVERWVVEYAPSCVLVPLDAGRSRVLLTRQHRYPVGRDLWELPGGMIDPGESSEECAVRELEEETGHQVLGDVTHLLSFHPEPAFADHKIDLFMAKVTEQPRDGFDPDADVETTAWVTLTDALSWISDGEIGSSWTIIGLLSAALLRQRVVT